MNKKVSLPVSFALIWILFRVILHTFNFGSQIKLGFFANIFLIITLVMYALHVKVKKEKQFESFVVNFKDSVKNAGIYLLIVIGFVFVYHQFVNPNYLESFHNEKMKIEYEKVKDFETIQKNTPGIQHFKTKEEYLENAEEVSKIFTSKKLIITLYFLGLFMFSIFFSVLIPLLYKKVVLRI